MLCCYACLTVKPSKGRINIAIRYINGRRHALQPTWTKNSEDFQLHDADEQQTRDEHVEYSECCLVTLFHLVLKA